MKRKTWIVSALMYTLVFLVCFGVLHVFKKITTAGDSTEYTSKAAAETNIVIDGSADDTDRENGKMDGAEGSDLSEDTDELWNETEKNTHIRRETGYKGWSKTLPQVWPEVRKKSIIRLQGSSRQRMFIIRAQMQRMTEQLFSFL